MFHYKNEFEKSNQSMKSQKSHAFFPNDDDVEGSNLNVPTVNRSGFSFCHFVLNVIPAAAGCSLQQPEEAAQCERGG